MSGKMAEGHLQVLQIYHLLQYVHVDNKVQIKKMLKCGVDNLVNLTEPKDGTGALHVAVAANNDGSLVTELVRFLLSHGALPDIQDSKGRTPVMFAAELGNDAILALLAHNDADMSLRDAEGKGVLFYCIYPTKRHTRCLQVALKFKADANNISDQGTPVFQLMCEKALECSPKCLIMLNGGADPNATNEATGVTALMEAARAGLLPLVRAILKSGGNPNILDKQRLTAVHYAAMGGFFEVIQLLSAYSADMGVISMEEWTPLHYAAVAGEANCCKFLAQRGCNAKLKNYEGLLPRQIAKDAGHKAAAKELRKAEKQPSKSNKSTAVAPLSDLWALTLHDWSNENETDIRQACGDKSDVVPAEKLISVLEELQAPVDDSQLQVVVTAHDKSKEACINISDFIKGTKYIKKPFLLSSYVPKKKKEKGGKGGKKKGKFVLPLPICTLTPELMPRRADGGPPHFLIETYWNQSDPQRFDPDHPPIHPVMNDSGWYLEKPNSIYINIGYCVKSGDVESMDLAFSQGVPVDVQDQFYKTPLMLACSTGNYEMAQYLLSRGADVNMCDQFLWTPLHHAAHAGQVELIELLVEAGASVDALALNGGTPLMRAIASSQSSCVDYLIKAGASIVAENKKEKNCLDIARDFGDARVIESVQLKMDSLPISKDGKGGKAQKAQKSKSKVFATEAAGTSTAMTGKSSLKELKDVIQQNTNIITGKSNTVDITFVPKTVWGKPPTTNQLMSKIHKRNAPLSLELDFEDFMVPFSHTFHRQTLDQPMSTEQTRPRFGDKH